MKRNINQFESACIARFAEISAYNMAECMEIYSRCNSLDVMAKVMNTAQIEFRNVFEIIKDL